MPTANVSPESWVDVTLATAQLSVVVGSDHVATAEQLPASLLNVMSANAGPGWAVSNPMVLEDPSKSLLYVMSS